MKLRDMMFLVIGGLLVISGMVLNSLISGDADAQEGVKDGKFRYITCEGLVILDGNGKWRGSFGLSDDGDATLRIYGDDGKTPVAYLGMNKSNNEMIFRLLSKSKTDKRMASMHLDRNGGRFDSDNKMGEQVVRIAVGNDGGGAVGTFDKFGYVKKTLQ